MAIKKNNFNYRDIFSIMTTTTDPIHVVKWNIHIDYTDDSIGMDDYWGKYSGNKTENYVSYSAKCKDGIFTDRNDNLIESLGGIPESYMKRDNIITDETHNISVIGHRSPEQWNNGHGITRDIVMDTVHYYVDGRQVLCEIEEPWAIDDFYDGLCFPRQTLSEKDFTRFCEEHPDVCKLPDMDVFNSFSELKTAVENMHCDSDHKSVPLNLESIASKADGKQSDSKEESPAD